MELIQIRDCCWHIMDKEKYISNVGTLFLWGYPDEFPQMGYELSHLYRNKGIMTWALKQVINITTIPFFLSIHTQNKASSKVALKCGFVPTSRRGYCLRWDHPKFC